MILFITLVETQPRKVFFLRKVFALPFDTLPFFSSLFLLSSFLIFLLISSGFCLPLRFVLILLFFFNLLFFFSLFHFILFVFFFFLLLSFVRTPFSFLLVTNVFLLHFLSPFASPVLCFFQPS